jgi:hypothetical protein
MPRSRRNPDMSIDEFDAWSNAQDRSKQPAHKLPFDNASQ